MRQFVCSLLVLGTVFTPVAGSAAELDKETVRQQLSALADYLSWNFLPQEDGGLTQEELKYTIESGAVFLVNAQEEHGHFRYEYQPYEGRYSNDDNMVRQAGVLYALGEIARRSMKRPDELDRAIELAIAYFAGISREDSYNGQTFLCIPNNELSTNCKLGSTALALAGMLGYVEADPEKTEMYEDTIEAYKEFLLAMKKDGEGFRNSYRIGNSLQSDEESPFFNGEALMALVRYELYTPSAEVREVIDDTFAYLAAKEEFETPLYLWIMAALKDLHALNPSDQYVSYTHAFTGWRVDGVSRHRTTDRNYCAYLEGLVSAYSILDGTVSGTERDALRSEIDYWLARNDRLQLDAEYSYRVIERDGHLLLAVPDDLKRAHGGFLTARDELTQRIDFTQHCITAYVQVLIDLDDGELY